MTFYNASEHTSRKLRVCDNCRQPINVGDRYSKECGVWDGEFYTVISHPECKHDRSVYIQESDLDPLEGCGMLIEEIAESGVKPEEFNLQPVTLERIRATMSGGPQHDPRHLPAAGGAA